MPQDVQQGQSHNLSRAPSKKRLTMSSCSLRKSALISDHSAHDPTWFASQGLMSRRSFEIYRQEMKDKLLADVKDSSAKNESNGNGEELIYKKISPSAAERRNEGFDCVATSGHGSAGHLQSSNRYDKTHDNDLKKSGSRKFTGSVTSGRPSATSRTNRTQDKEFMNGFNASDQGGKLSMNAQTTSNDRDNNGPLSAVSAGAFTRTST